MGFNNMTKIMQEKKRHFLRWGLLLMAVCLVQTVWAVRAKTEWHTYTLNDGSQVELTLQGDAHFHYYLSRDGRCFEFDDDGFRPLSAAEMEQRRARTPRKAENRALYDYINQWDSNRTYRQAVILVNFNDEKFSMDDPQAYYNDLFNVSGPKGDYGYGSMADYFRDQSQGKANMVFDIFGPVEVDISAQSFRYQYGETMVAQILKDLNDSQDIDFSVYDWNNDGEVRQIIYITAGYCSNLGGTKTAKYLWPNTGWMGTPVTLKGDVYNVQYSLSCEKWYTANGDILCGIGTICHEFCHCLGLPDLYPTAAYYGISVVDEWDLMDGGNYTAWGWNPPNLSAMERNLLGWSDIEEAQPGGYALKPIADGGAALRVGSGNDYYLLENRQRTGWDRYLPGEGLVITYVNYDEDIWLANNVNASNPFRYELVAADTRSYSKWDDYITANHLSNYILDEENRLQSRYMSTAAWPLANNSTSDCTTLPYHVTGIHITPEGVADFNIVEPTSIGASSCNSDAVPVAFYDLQGRRLSSPTKGFVIVGYSDGSMKTMH